MPGLTALIHTHNDALRLGRCLETLYPCDSILIVDHESEDRTQRVAREYGASILDVESAARGNEHISRSNTQWLLCLDPRESLTEALAASLYEWKCEVISQRLSFSVHLREERKYGWFDNPTAQTRIVPPGWNRWEGNFPAHNETAVTLNGGLLRFDFP